MNELKILTLETVNNIPYLFVYFIPGYLLMIVLILTTPSIMMKNKFKGLLSFAFMFSYIYLLTLSPIPNKKTCFMMTPENSQKTNVIFRSLFLESDKDKLVRLEHKLVLQQSIKATNTAELEANISQLRAEISPIIEYKNGSQEVFNPKEYIVVETEAKKMTILSQDKEVFYDFQLGPESNNFKRVECSPEIKLLSQEFHKSLISYQLKGEI